MLPLTLRESANLSSRSRTAVQTTADEVDVKMLANQRKTATVGHFFCTRRSITRLDTSTSSVVKVLDQT